ncbi:hypothetical protein [Saccharibacillus kuerlensis]|uniref:Uncharacterized protein n=1 Tax=Saccharibacillus kuerlensis TaxID=459527 RepID=A0ABQ2KZJ6_9BACL|nr:hypothetical protein [Saccharibacillus kuerlensis]GGN97962.1 hypothetical protein GCM10010969_16420 [Saccharibacillus kuerlensis]
MELLFEGRSWTVGKSDIRRSDGTAAGMLDRRAMTSLVHVLDNEEYVMYQGRMERHPRSWVVRNEYDEVVGRLRKRAGVSFKHFVYDAGTRGVFEITKDSAARRYRIEGPDGIIFAEWDRRWGRTVAYRLQPESGSGTVSQHEWIAALLGLEELIVDPVLLSAAVSGVLSLVWWT